MRYTERTEIAKAINGRKMPVVTIDLAKRDEYGLVSEPIVIDNGTFRDGFPWMIHSEIRAYRDERKFKTSSSGVCLHASFGYSDMEEMLTYRNAPVLHKDEDVLICIINSATREAYAPFTLHTKNRIDPHCTTPLTFEDSEENFTLLWLAMSGYDIKEA